MTSGLQGRWNESMPLTASSNEKDFVLACDMKENDRASKYYFCRHCGAEMRLVLPEKNIINHFRHLSNNGCVLASESPKHLEAKQFFYDLYKNNPLYNNVELESSWNGLEHDRIGDVVLYPKERNVHPTVIEVQNSSISIDEINERFIDWNTFDLTPDGLYAMLWVLTDNVVIPNDPDIEARVPKWARLLHQIYMGRTYIYSDAAIYATHFHSVSRYNEWTGGAYYLKTTKYIESQKVINYNILQTNSGGGKYGDNRLISRFYDKKFW